MFAVGLFMREAKDIIWLLRRMPKIMIQTVLLLVRRFNCSLSTSCIMQRAVA